MKCSGLHLSILVISISMRPSAVTTASDVSGKVWPQWGGPTGDFKSPVTGLADRWPVDGPPRLWDRALGEGYAPVSARGSRLFTTYRDGNDEIVVAIDAKTGTDLWSYRYRARTFKAQTREFGQGPSAAPLIIGDRLITIGFTGIVHCLDATTGNRIWSHDLVKDFSGKVHYYGYANSPIAYHGLVLILVGGEKNGVIALHPANGKSVWKSKAYDTSYASPILADVDGQDQLVFFTTNQVVGINAENGNHLWDHTVANFCKTNCTPAIWSRDNLLWAATKGVGGTRMLKLSRRHGNTHVKEAWENRKIKVYHWNAQRVGDFVYASSGDSHKFLSIIDTRTGEIRKRIRGFGSINSIHVDNKLIMLDSGGKLALAKIVPGDLEIVSETLVRESIFWTPPTLVGSTLIVRDRKRLVAFDLGIQEPQT